MWSKLLESTRKDAERTFGVMKKRFRILKVPLLYRDAVFIQHIFVTCAVLHNMLLHRDQQFQRGTFRHGVSTTLPRARRRTILVNNVSRLLRANDDFSFMQQGGLLEDNVTQVDTAFGTMRKRLATHAYYLFVNDQLFRN